MSSPMKNRCFLTPRTPDGSIPKGWTRTIAGNDWGGPVWQAGVWRAVGGGAFPSRGDRCLLVGADDAATDTVSKPIHTGDAGLINQAVAGAALTNIAEAAVDVVVADQGYDPGHTLLMLRDTDPSTSTLEIPLINTFTEYEQASVVLDITGADLSGDNTFSIGWYRDATSASGNRRIPRVYFDDFRFYWNPYFGPIRILKYTDDQAPNATITGGTAGTGFSVENVANYVASDPYVTATAGSGWIEFDMGGSFTDHVNLFSLIDCNFASGEYYELFYGAVSPAATSLGQFPVNNGRNSFLEFSRVTSGHRYWRVEFAKTVGAADKAFTIGECVFGEARHLQKNYQWGPARGQQFGAKILETDYSRRWTDKTHTRRTYTMPFGQLKTEDSFELIDILEDSHGGTYPALVIPDPTAYDVFYGYFQTSVSEVIRAYQLRSIGELSFIEQTQAVVQT